MALSLGIGQATTVAVTDAQFPWSTPGADAAGIRVSTVSQFTTNGVPQFGTTFDGSYVLTFSAYRNIGSNAYFTATDSSRLSNESALVPNAVFSQLNHRYTGVTNSFSAIGVDPNISSTGAINANTNPGRSLAGQIDSGFAGGEALVISFNRPSAVNQLTLGFAMGTDTAPTAESDPRTLTGDISSNLANEIVYIRIKRAGGSFRDFYMRVLTSFDTTTTGETPTAAWFTLPTTNGSGGSASATSGTQGGGLPTPVATVLTTAGTGRFLGQWTIGTGLANIFGGIDDIVRLEMLPYTANGSGLQYSDFGFNSIIVTPEPWSLLLGGTAIAALALRRRYMKKS